MLIASVVLPSALHADPLRHFVFGLKPLGTYGVTLSGRTVMRHAHPGPAGEIQFMGTDSCRVHVYPDFSFVVGNTPDAATDPPGGIALAPNPASGTVHVFVASATRARAELELVSILGRRGASMQVDLEPGVTALGIDLPRRLAAGFYLVRLRVGPRIMSGKLLVVR